MEEMLTALGILFSALDQISANGKIALSQDGMDCQSNFIKEAIEFCEISTIAARTILKQKEEVVCPDKRTA